MIDEQAGAAAMSAAETPGGVAWGDAIDEGRKQELWGRLRAWWEETDHGARKGPFERERLTGAEVFWLAVCALAEGDESTVDEAEGRLREAQYDPHVRAQLRLSLLNLGRTNLSEAQMQEAILSEAQMQEADLSDAQMIGAILTEAQFAKANLSLAQLDRANLAFAQLEGADFSYAELRGAYLHGAKLEGADLSVAQLQIAHLQGAQLEGANLTEAQLQGADLRQVGVDGKTRFVDATLCAALPWWRRGPLARGQRGVAPALGDINWNGVGTVDLTQIADWDRVERLGDERRVSWRASADKQQAVVRAYRQVATQLRAQGMSEVADRLSHRALAYERRVFLRRGNIGRYVGSWLLALLAGYGYRPLYTIIWYLVVIFGCALTYWHFGPSEGVPFSALGAVVFSVTSFHGRGFFPGGNVGHGLTLDDPITVVAAAEAVVGLLIEISFIATFTQRFFGAK